MTPMLATVQGPSWAGWILWLPLISLALCGVCAAMKVRTKLPGWITVGFLGASFGVVFALYQSYESPMTIPLFRWFGGVGFVDVGNVFESPRSIDFADLVGSFGAGLRVSTPFALLRADVARLWSPEAGQPTARWTFGIGHTF